MQRRKPILVAGFLAFFAPASQGAEAVVGADLAAQGGAAAAASDRNAAITVNPGLIALHDRYDINGQFRYGPDALTQWAVGAVDTRTSRWLSLGLMYVGDRSEPALRTSELPGWTTPGDTPPNVRRHHDFTLAGAVQGWDRRFAVGLSGTFSIYNHDRHGAGSTGNIDAGIGARPTDWLDLGVAGRNLVPVNDVGDLVLTVVGGARVHGDPGSILAEVEWRETDLGSPLTFAGGGELPLGETARLRLGHRYEGPTERHKVTGGLGLGNDSGSVDFGVQVPVGADLDVLGGTAFLISVNLAAPRVDEPVGW